MSERYILVGSGGHSRVIHELACKCNIDVSIISVRDDSVEIPDYYTKLQVLTDHQVFTEFSPDNTNILLGIGHMPNDNKRSLPIYKWVSELYFL